MKEIWVHIDHIDNPDGAVWAVQVPKDGTYKVCHEVRHARFRTKTRKRKQPRARIVVRAQGIRVTKKGRKQVVTIF